MASVKLDHALSLLTLGTLAFVVGCNASGSDTATKTDTPATGGTTVAFSQVQGILTANCTKCHGDKDPKDGVTLTNYEGISKIVKAGDPAGSKLVEVMKGGEGHKPKMPPMGDPVTAADVKIVEDWIQAGAKSS